MINQSVCSLFAAALIAASIPLSARELKYENPRTQIYVEEIAANVRSGKMPEIRVADLAKTYQNNEVVADTKYKNRYLFVDAVVDRVAKDAFDEIVVYLRTSNQFMPAAARFDKTVNVITGLDTPSKIISIKTRPTIDAVSLIQRGSKVHLICVGDGMFAGTPQLRLCNVLSM